MGKKKKGGGGGQKKKTRKANDTAGNTFPSVGAGSSRPEGVDQVIQGRGHLWPEPESLPKRRTGDACTCYRNILKADGVYEPKTCLLHEDSLSQMPMARLSPLGTSLAAVHSAERQISMRTKGGSVAVPNGSNPATATWAPKEFLEEQLDEYTSLLNNSWGDKLSDSDRAEVLTRQSTLFQALSRQKEALSAADEAIGLRPSFAQSYYAAGQAAFALSQYHKACDRFREGLREAPNRKEMQEAFRVALLEANKAKN